MLKLKNKDEKELKSRTQVHAFIFIKTFILVKNHSVLIYLILSV